MTKHSPDLKHVAQRRERPVRTRPMPLSIRLLRAREAVMRRLRPLLQRHGVTEQQWRILRILHETGDLEVKALARYACIQVASASRIVSGLETERLVTRRTPQSDQRRSVISIAAPGVALIGKISPAVDVLYRDIAATVGARKLQAISAALDEFTRQLWPEGMPD
jgi:homoprotocatechuate degradation regulator HpaR